MNRAAYYGQLKVGARRVREEFGLTTPRVTLTDMRRIYKTYGIKIDLWPHRMKAVRGAYFNDEFGVRVMVNGNLPAEQRIFTLAHELKHHLFDPAPAQQSEGDEDKEPKEIGAEIFAAELIFPEEDFSRSLVEIGVAKGSCTPEDIIRLKRETKTTLSFTSLGKRAEFLGFAPKGSMVKVRWKVLEEELYGEPDYKRILRLKREQASLS